MPDVTILAFDNCLASGVTGLMDVLAIANQLWRLTQDGAEPLFTWQLCSADGQAVLSSSGLSLAVAAALPAALAADLIVLPALHYQGDEALLAQVEPLSQRVGPWLRQAYQEQRLLAACCTSTFILAESHLLDGKQATTSWWLGKLFHARYPTVRLALEDLLTEDDRVLCAGAIAAHLDMGLRIIRKFGGDFLALACAKTMLIDANRTAQTPYMMLLQPQLNHRDDLVLQAQTLMQANLAQPFSLDALAAQVQVSPRTLVRRFQQATQESPVTYLQALRVETAKRLLETTNLNFEEIVARVGYSDLSSFRRLFKRHTSLSPRDYRRRFGIGATGVEVMG